MKKLFFIAIYLFSFFFSQSQTSINIGPYISLGSQTREDDGAGVGISAEAAKNLFQKGAVRLYSGYTQFPKDIGGRVRFIPVRAGYQQELFKNVFAFADAGTGTLFYPSFHYTRLSYDIGATYRIQLLKNFFQLSIAYNHTKDNSESYFGWVDYRIAYGFNFKE